MAEVEENIIFQIDALPDRLFRVAHVKPTRLLSALSIGTTRGADGKVEIGDNEKFYDFILESTEIELDEKWYPVKERGKEVYFPVDIGDNFKAVREIISKWEELYLTPLFKESKTSS